ncbi:DUF4232 domain-containing protein [Paenarthrobacter sp. DKR-5]|uniref:DUF4232 domain-containing protein n=1 Tax=Paenarthrobacter sp. DKR-5 TaxID=2835535 RepID=UPI001BDC8AEC|nr:DUF4232 domain-containing protein [Paenarthrobacter sp. DKR-5]MBT1003517.1 DUF4232 domain-containing protein [Paenarthrobacter sp. DKR-5]
MSVWVGKKGLVLAAALLSVTALSSCANQAGPAAVSSAGSSAPASAADTATASDSSTASESPTTESATASATPAVTPAAPAGLCAASMLKGSLDATGGGAAGSVYMKLIVTNTSGAACTIKGFPGVSLVAKDHTTQLGAAAVRDNSTTAVAVKLAPGAKSFAVLRYTNAQNYGTRCQQVQADAFRVYPPSATDKLFVTSPQIACSNTDINLLTIGAFQPM